jgi:L-seryl-tRNA(Ser) seleniumtransferase
VSALLESAPIRGLLASTPRDLVVGALRDAIADARAAADDPEGRDWAADVARRLERDALPSLRPAINATGVVLHTNLGRAPLAAAALAAVDAAARGYSNLEYDLATGARGSRYDHCAALLRELTGAEDALVVNNCAAALVLALSTVASGREAILSRGELVEIGGSFRVHEIVERAGVRLRSVGATNRTHVGDYVRAITADTGALLKVHRSNFAMSGFVAEVPVRELVPAAREHGIPIVHDLGSGLLVGLDDIGLRGEPTARQALAEGASVVLMSGDKLLGGPQAGIIAGSAPLVAAMRRNPLARSYRVDKMTLAALGATLALYRDPARARREIPVLAMLAEAVDSVRARAGEVAARLGDAGIPAEVRDSTATVGAGAFPTSELPSAAVTLEGGSEAWGAALRAARVPVVGRVIDGRMALDLRTVPADSMEALIAGVLGARP